LGDPRFAPLNDRRGNANMHNVTAATAPPPFLAPMSGETGEPNAGPRQGRGQ
jgi:hypothetical protein